MMCYWRVSTKHRVIVYKTVSEITWTISRTRVHIKTRQLGSPSATVPPPILFTSHFIALASDWNCMQACYNILKQNYSINYNRLKDYFMNE